MPQRTCDACGKTKDVSGGKICEKSHFICKDCVYSGVIFISESKACPICRRALR